MLPSRLQPFRSLAAIGLAAPCGCQPAVLEPPGIDRFDSAGKFRLSEIRGGRFMMLPA